jgi:rfaE bifunctional protein kinase chain/domain
MDLRLLNTYFTKLRKLKVFVIGDSMIDAYWIGKIDRISPEAPVPVVLVERKESRPGGAANVALNCKALGADVYLFSIIGKDDSGKLLKELVAKDKIHVDGMMASSNRTTTTKTRVMAKNQHMIRLDEETTQPLTIKEEHAFIDTCLRAIQIEVPDLVIFEDYNKGVLTVNVIEKIITHCKHVGVLTAVDPKKENFFSYKHVDIFKPNLKEIKEGLQLSDLVVDKKWLQSIHRQLHKTLEHAVTLITLSDKGIFVQDAKQSNLLPAFIRNIADVSGAGDTVIAVAAMMYKISNDSLWSAKIANLAGGLVCEEVGVVPINKDKLLNECREQFLL